MTNNNDDSDDYPEVPREVLEGIEKGDAASTVTAEELYGELEPDSEDATWIVEEMHSTFYTDQVAVHRDRIDAVEHALRLAKQASEGSGGGFDAGIARERKLLIGTEHVYEVFVGGGDRWRVVRGLPEDGKVPLPDCEAATAGWPDEDPPEPDLDADPEEWMEPLPDDVGAGKSGEVWEEPYPHEMEDKGRYGWLVRYHKVPTVYETVARVEREIDAREYAVRRAREHSRESGEPVEVFDVRSVHEDSGREYEYEEVVCGQEEWIIVPAPPEDDVEEER